MFGYAVPNLLIDHAMRNPHVPPGFWRGVNLNQNAIYVECFIDEIAHATKQDPLALRRKLIQDPKRLAVLNAVAERIGWERPAADVGGQKVFRGLAQTHGFGSYVAACAEVSVSKEGDLKIHRIVAATDPGHAVNPQQIEAQVEGSFVYGLSAALYGACTVKDGAIAADQLPRLPGAADGGDAEGRDDRHRLGRFLGRRRRADDRGCCAGGAERHLRRDRHPRPRPAAREDEPEEGLTGAGAAT